MGGKRMEEGDNTATWYHLNLDMFPQMCTHAPYRHPHRTLTHTRAHSSHPDPGQEGQVRRGRDTSSRRRVVRGRECWRGRGAGDAGDPSPSSGEGAASSDGNALALASAIWVGDHGAANGKGQGGSSRSSRNGSSRSSRSGGGCYLPCMRR